MLRRSGPVSIDIGSFSVKVAQLRSARGGVRAIRCAEERLPANFHWEPGGDNLTLVAAIRSAMAKAGIRARSAIMSLPRRHVTARVSAFPVPLRRGYRGQAVVDRGQLRRVVEYDLADHLPFPVDQVVMDLQVLGPSLEQPGLSDVLVVAAQREFVRQYLDLAKQLGLRPVALTVDSLSLHDLTRRMGEGPPGLTLTIDIGHRAATINISAFSTAAADSPQAGRLWLTRSVPLGGQQLTAAFRDDLGVTVEEAEARKINEGFAVAGRGLPGQGDRSLQGRRAERVAAWLENLCGELRRSALSFGQAAISRIFLVGAGSQVPGLAEAIGRELGVEPVDLTVPGLFPQARVRDESGTASACLLAIGQGLRGVGRSAWTISLLPPEMAQQQRARRSRIAGICAGGVAAAAVVAFYLLSASAIRGFEVKKKHLEQAAKAAQAQQTQATELLAARDQLRAQMRTLIVDPRHRHAALEILRTVSEAASPKVRLVAFNMAADQPLVIRGTAPDQGAVADLQEALSKSPLVTEVTVENATRSVERVGRSGGPARMTRRQPAEETQATELVSFVIKARLWSKPKGQAKTATLAQAGGGG